MEKRPPESTGGNVVGQPSQVELYEKNLESVEDGPPRKTRGRLHITWRRFLEGGFLAVSVHRWRRSTLRPLYRWYTDTNAPSHANNHTTGSARISDVTQGLDPSARGKNVVGFA
jgi:hypothetical protein